MSRAEARRYMTASAARAREAHLIETALAFLGGEPLVNPGFHSVGFSPMLSAPTGQGELQAQEPCRDGWARYLCVGGCHLEVIRRGRPACEYLRGWLHYCLEAYLRLSPSGLDQGRRTPAEVA